MKARLTLKALTASLLLASCAQTQTRQDVVYIQPLQDVRHSYEQAKAQYELGRYFHGQLRYRLAIEAYRRALTLDPRLVDAMNAMGAAYAESGRFALAREQFEAALKLDPHSVSTYNNLGFVNYLAGDYPAAADAYKQALRLDARHEKARHNLVQVMERMGRGDQIARSEAQQAVAAPSRATVVPEAPARRTWVEVSPSVYEMHARGGAGGMTAPVAVSTPPAAAQPAAAFEAVRGLEVSNGNGVRGMAAKVARYLSEQGVARARLTNQKPFVERVTRIEYRPGSAGEAAKINRLLPVVASQVASNDLRRGVDVRLVLGHDLGLDVALWTAQPAPQRVAALTPTALR